MRPHPHAVQPSLRWRVLSTLGGGLVLTAGAMWSGLPGLLLMMAALVPMGAAAANVSLVADLRATLRQCWGAPDEGPDNPGPR